MKNILSIEEFIEQRWPNYHWNQPSAEELAKDFAKYHVQACKEEIFDKQEIEQYKKEEQYDYPGPEHFRATKKSIENAYPESNIV